MSGETAPPQNLIFPDGYYWAVPPTIEPPLEPYLLDIPDSPEEDAPAQEMPAPPEPFERQVLRASQMGIRVLWFDPETNAFVYAELVKDAKMKLLLGDYTKAPDE